MAKILCGDQSGQAQPHLLFRHHHLVQIFGYFEFKCLLFPTIFIIYLISIMQKIFGQMTMAEMSQDDDDLLLCLEKEAGFNQSQAPTFQAHIQKEENHPSFSSQNIAGFPQSFDFLSNQNYYESNLEQGWNPDFRESDLEQYPLEQGSLESRLESNNLTEFEQNGDQMEEQEPSLTEEPLDPSQSEILFRDMKIERFFHPREPELHQQPWDLINENVFKEKPLVFPKNGNIIKKICEGSLQFIQKQLKYLNEDPQIENEIRRFIRTEKKTKNNTTIASLNKFFGLNPDSRYPLQRSQLMRKLHHQVSNDIIDSLHLVPQIREHKKSYMMALKLYKSRCRSLQLVGRLQYLKKSV